VSKADRSSGTEEITSPVDVLQVALAILPFVPRRSPVGEHALSLNLAPTSMGETSEMRTGIMRCLSKD